MQTASPEQGRCYHKAINKLTYEENKLMETKEDQGVLKKLIMTEIRTTINLKALNKINQTNCSLTSYKGIKEGLKIYQEKLQKIK